MKIEKLTENKIRIIIKSEDIEDENIDLHTIMTKTAESQGILLEILNCPVSLDCKMAQRP